MAQVESKNEQSVPREWLRLQEMRAARDIDGLIRELDNPRSEETDKGSMLTIREEAVTQLAKARDQRAVAPIEKLLDDPLPSVRSCAAGALGRIGEQSAIPSLAVALGDQEEEVRWNAARSLGDLRAAVATPNLIAALDDPNKWVRSTAARSLSRIGDRRALAPLKYAMRREGFGHPIRSLLFGKAILRLRLKGSDIAQT